MCLIMCVFFGYVSLDMTQLVMQVNWKSGDANKQDHKQLKHALPRRLKQTCQLGQLALPCVIMFLHQHIQEPHADVLLLFVSWNFWVKVLPTFWILVKELKMSVTL